MEMQGPPSLMPPSEGTELQLAPENEKTRIKGLSQFANMTKTRQIVLLAVLALSVPLIIVAVLWSQEPEYTRLFDHLSENDTSEIVEALHRMNVNYHLDPATGAIDVPSKNHHEARYKLASLGLPKEGTAGLEIMEQGNQFGSSQLTESVRYQRAQEGELARSIMSIRDIKSARVHLALPKESVFVRQARKPSASVMLELRPGRHLEKPQVDAIVHLVASSIPQLDAHQITVVDQQGHMLNAEEDLTDLSSRQFDYKRGIENHLIERIDNILSPIVGRNGVRTQVSADIDFTVTEQTQETFDGQKAVMRGEQVAEESSQQTTPQGVPGALSNQPPAAGAVPQNLQQQPIQGAGGNEAAGGPTKNSRSATRNYEVDKTISHTKMSTGTTRRLTVAVVVDHQRQMGADGRVITQAFSEEDLGRFTSLVKEAVGFDESRGDRVTVTNAAFVNDAEPEVELPFWEQEWFWRLFKEGGIGLLVLLLILFVLRPGLKALLPPPVELEPELLEPDADGTLLIGPDGLPVAEAEEDFFIPQVEEEVFTVDTSTISYEKKLGFVQRTIDQDPRRVASILIQWMSVRA